MNKVPAMIFTEKESISDSFLIRPIPRHSWNDLVYRLAYHRIFLIRSGSGHLIIDGARFEISGTELFLAAKGQVISFCAEVEGYELCFGDCFWERSPQSANNCKAVLFNNVARHHQLALSEADHHELVLLFSSVYTESEKPVYSNKLDALAAYLKIIMIKIANISELLEQGTGNPDTVAYNRFLELVKKEYKKAHEVAYFAETLNIPARKLSDLCKKYAGKGAKEVINEQLIVEAKRFLQFTSVPIKEIAYELNFSTAEQFSHFFKKNTLISPREHRLAFVNIDMQYA